MTAPVDTSTVAVEARAARLDRYAQQRASEALAFALADCPRASQAVREDAETIAGDAATLRALARERDRLRRGWLATIQTENSCPATGGGCLAKRCGCVEELEMLLREDAARAALKDKT